jgi:hypothetical protein
MTGETLKQLSAALGILWATKNLTEWGYEKLVWYAREYSRRWTKKKEGDVRTLALLTMIYLPMAVLLGIGGENEAAALCVGGCSLLIPLFILISTMETAG